MTKYPLVYKFRDLEKFPALPLLWRTPPMTSQIHYYREEGPKFFKNMIYPCQYEETMKEYEESMSQYDPSFTKARCEL